LVITYICTMQQLDEDLQVRWLKLRIKLKEQFGIKPDMNGVLMIIGVQELGQGPQNFSKEQKQDLMHVAVCTLLSTRGYFELEGVDEDGWPHYKQTQGVDAEEMITQELLLRSCIIEYFGV